MAFTQSPPSPFWRRSPPFGLALWLFVLPLALTGLGTWQAQRAASMVEIETASVDGLRQRLGKVRQFGAEDPEALLRFPGDGTDVTVLKASETTARIETALASLETDLTVARARVPLAWATIGASLLVVAGTGSGLLAARVAGWRARRSRDQLIESFGRLRVVLPVLMAAVVLGFGVALFCATSFEAMSLWFWERVSGNGIKLAGAGIVLAALAAYGAVMAVVSLRRVFDLFTPQPIDVLARVVGEDEAPGLWRFTREIAARQGAPLPDTIIVGLTEGFYVTEGAVRIEPEGRLLEGRTLYLPAPALELLDTAEVSAIIGHELAHFTGDDTRYSRKFTPIYATLWRSLEALHQANRGAIVVQPATRLGFHAIGQFDVAVAHWSRLREFEADRNGSLISRPAGAASALIRSSIIEPAVSFVLQRAFQAPETGEDDLVAATARLTAEEGFPDPAAHLEDRQPHPTDSHPPTSQRIEALGVAIDEPVLAHATRRPEPGVPSFGRKAFADWDAICRALSLDFLTRARGAHAEYRESLETAAAAVGSEALVLYDNAKPMIWVMGIASGFFAIIGIGAVAAAAQIGFGHDEWAQAILAAVGATGFLGFAAIAIVSHRRSRAPLFVLTPEHLETSRFLDPIPWTDVEQYQVYANQRFALQLVLHEEAPLPARRGFWFYSKVNRRRRTVTIDAFGVKGMKVDAFSELIGRYLHAAYARRELVAPKE
ncbi:M48 family metallopeptidase [Aureimonas pseudogalii]|uniref:Zn-dependent protease with chaperone function n=1 Tax=Aureimonas pseudogalii TaxID=1744844 RepID=A0A7W6MLX5_9HYPH|nr:M48 family metallopeptidase [Aureimonas pseudogalii]MBB4000210.1 Zn-dependent protease with chaperone function [Aureimonas pseudogalii]